MRVVLRCVVLSCAVLTLACQGAKGDPGPQGPKGDTGAQGPAGTFSGTTSSAVQFDGPVAINGTLTVGGNDLFAASMQSLSPAVLVYTNGFAAGHSRCGAPTTLDLSTTVGVNNATYGEIIYTSKGAFNITQSGPPISGACSNTCTGPLTFFLTSPTAQTITLQGNLDNGPSSIYVDGAVVATVSSGPNFNQGINVPAGPFALSMVACSSDGYSNSFFITNPFLQTYNLSIDIDRTFHRNGK